MSQHLTSQAAEQAAEAIAHLINSRVQSPTKAELTAIIARHVGSGTASAPALPDPDAAARMDALRVAIRDVETLLDSDDEFDRVQVADRRVDKLTKLAWATPPRTLADFRSAP